jgi:hypothetical protein
MGRGEVQREMRIAAPVIAQRTAVRAAARPDGRLQMGAVVGAQLHRLWLARIAPVRVPPGQLVQETLPAGLARATAAALIPGQKCAVRRRRRGKIPPALRIPGHLWHNTTLLVTRPWPVATPELSGYADSGKWLVNKTMARCGQTECYRSATIA